MGTVAPAWHPGAMCVRLLSMPALELVLFTLGRGIVKSAIGLWLGENKLAVGLAESSLDTLSERLSTARERRRLAHVADNSAEMIADRLEPFIQNEMPGLDAGERFAAIGAVNDTLNRIQLTEADLFAADLDAGHLDRYVRSRVPDAKDRALLNEPARALYDLVLRESCTYIIQVRSALPRAGISALAEQLRRDRELLELLQEALDRLPERRGQADFERDYRQLVVNQLDQVEFFGATLSEGARRYPLSVAYLSLTASEESDTPVQDEDPSRTQRVEEILSKSRRLFIRGDAGLGKTTLLQWIAVKSASGSFPESLGDWNDTIPFFIALRGHAEGPLPAPEEFVSELGRHLSAEMPEQWAHGKLRDGKAILLIDGVDELSDSRREDVRRWLDGLITTFGSARYIVTSRPAAAPTTWLGDQQFKVQNLEPMSSSDVQEFIHRWHDAMRTQATTLDDRNKIASYESKLLQQLGSRAHLRRLARYPLLCALICALHKDRRAHLPGNRMELYEVALHMLLERRDTERGISTSLAMTRTTKTLLLQEIAYWLMRNQWSEAPTDRVVELIGRALPDLPDAGSEAHVTYRQLLERTGLLREPVHGKTDFVHRTFQEYLAAKAAMDADDVGVLLEKAELADWREVILMAVNHASPAQRVDLIEGLLLRAEVLGDEGDGLRLLAVASLETAPQLESGLRGTIEVVARKLLPPKTMGAARLMAAAGPFVLDLLSASRPTTARQVAATLRTVSEIGDPAGLRIISRYVNDRRRAVYSEIRKASNSFDPQAFGEQILSHLVVEGRLELVSVGDVRAIPFIAGLKEAGVDADHVFELNPWRSTLGGPIRFDNPTLERLVVRRAGPGIFRHFLATQDGPRVAVEPNGRQQGEWWNRASSYSALGHVLFPLLHTQGAWAPYTYVSMETFDSMVCFLREEDSWSIEPAQVVDASAKSLFIGGGWAEIPASLGRIESSRSFVAMNCELSDLSFLSRWSEELEAVVLDDAGEDLGLETLPALPQVRVAAFSGVSDWDEVSNAFPNIESAIILDSAFKPFSGSAPPASLKRLLFPRVRADTDWTPLLSELPDLELFVTDRSLSTAFSNASWAAGDVADFPPQMSVPLRLRVAQFVGF